MSPPPFTKEEPRQRQELDLTSDIWMGPPEWIKKHEDEFSTLTSDQSEKEVIILKSNDSKDDSDYLQVPITRRKSSPSLLDHSDREEDSSDEEEEDYTLLRRSSSYKIQSTHDNSDIKDVVDSPKIIKKTHKTPLGKVGKIFHVRKDSVKKQLSKKQKHLGEEGLEVDLEGEDEGPIGRSTPKTSPSVPRQRALEMAESPPSKSFTSHGTFDVSALMGK